MKKHKGLWVMGGVSLLYIVLFVFLRGPVDIWYFVREGNPNEIGDFLAGLSAPLAFGWLVYGYLLQSSELRLQREELALTRDKLGQQVELLEEQVNADSMPRLALRPASIKWWEWICENTGATRKIWNSGVSMETGESKRGTPLHTVDLSNSCSRQPTPFTPLSMRRASARTVQKGFGLTRVWWTSDMRR